MDFELRIQVTERGIEGCGKSRVDVVERLKVMQRKLSL
jgi:hypothetical protein